MASSSRPRGALEDLFPGLQISSRERSHSTPWKPTSKLQDILSKSLRRAGVPAWSTLKWSNKAQSGPANFTLKMTPELRNYKPGQVAPQEEFDEAKKLVEEIQTTLNKSLGDEKIIKEYGEFMMESMIDLIFSSNENEEAGLSHDETRKFCLRIFDGEVIDPKDITPRSKEYEQQLRFLVEQRKVGHPDEEDVIRSRREVIQHAMALKYIMDATLLRQEPLTENLLKETHKILTEGIPLQQATRRGDKYAGIYRTGEVHAGGIRFTLPYQIPAAMQRFITDFNEDVSNREKSGEMDPFYLAADICQDFVMIHPFSDGNGRMCRLLLNAFLIKYAGVVVGIGEHEHEREEYMEIVRWAGNEDEEEARQKLGRYVLEKATIKLRALKKRLNMGKEN